MADRMSGAVPSGAQGLISSEDVHDQPVIGTDGEELGLIQKLLIEGGSGRVAYAVVKLGGPITTANNYYPVPWQSLTIDTGRHAFRVNITRAQLADAPSYKEDEHPWAEAEFSRKVHAFYGASALT